MNEFKSILNFQTFIREVVKEHCYVGKDVNEDPIYEDIRPYPVIKFKGVHKIPGANGSVRRTKGKLYYQSRSIVLGDSDMCGFRAKMSKVDKINEFFSWIDSKFNPTDNDEVIIYGEWCGKNVPERGAITGSKEQYWIIFDIKISPIVYEYQGVTYKPGDEFYTERRTFVETSFNSIEFQDHSSNIYNVLEWPSVSYSLDLDVYDLNNLVSIKAPKELQDLVDSATLDCPVALSFGLSGFGEGLVFTSEDVSKRNGQPFCFKHKNSRYEKTPLEAAKKEPSVIPGLDVFLAEAVSEVRLSQKLNELRRDNPELSGKLIPEYQKLVLNDIAEDAECIFLAKEYNLGTKAYEAAVKKACSEYFKK